MLPLMGRLYFAKVSSRVRLQTVTHSRNSLLVATDFSSPLSNALNLAFVLINDRHLLHPHAGSAALSCGWE
jgi:hypothetical protein